MRLGAGQVSRQRSEGAPQGAPSRLEPPDHNCNSAFSLGFPAAGDAWDPEQADALDALEAQCEGWRLERAEAHERTADVARRARDTTRAQWHEWRARRLRRGWRERARVCRAAGADEARVWCDRCGATARRPLPCGHARWWCRRCAYREGRRLRDRLQRSIRAALARERARWRREGSRRGRRPDVALVTLTVRHSGDLARDRERIAQGWRRMRAWLHRRVGAPPYWGVWECAEGSDGRGHVHLHVVTLWPYLPYAEVRAEWERATDGHGRVLDVQRSTYRLRDGQRRRWTEHRAARYVAKYVTKSGEWALSVDHTLAARWIGATYGRRLVTASRGAWVTLPDPEPACHCCRDTEHLRWSVAGGASDGQTERAQGPPGWLAPEDRDPDLVRSWLRSVIRRTAASA